MGPPPPLDLVLRSYCSISRGGFWYVTLSEHTLEPCVDQGTGVFLKSRIFVINQKNPNLSHSGFCILEILKYITGLYIKGPNKLKNTKFQERAKINPSPIRDRLKPSGCGGGDAGRRVIGGGWKGWKARSGGEVCG